MPWLTVGVGDQGSMQGNLRGGHGLAWGQRGVTQGWGGCQVSAGPGTDHASTHAHSGAQGSPLSLEVALPSQRGGGSWILLYHLLPWPGGIQAPVPLAEDCIPAGDGQAVTGVNDVCLLCDV